jgi:predicted metal-dependent hydrolase
LQRYNDYFTLTKKSRKNSIKTELKKIITKLIQYILDVFNLFNTFAKTIIIITKAMEANETTIQAIERFIKKVAQKYPVNDEPTLMTDIHIRVNSDNGDLMAFDDDDNEINRCVVEEWIDNKANNIYEQITTILRQELSKEKDIVDNLSIIKPYSFVLEDEDRDNIAELYVVDDDTIIIGGELMAGLDEDLDEFFNRLFDSENS